MLCYVFERQVKALHKEVFFLVLVLCLVFTPLIGYQVSLVDSPIRRLSMVVGILDDHLTTEERLGSSSFVIFDLFLSSPGTNLLSRNERSKNLMSLPFRDGKLMIFKVGIIQ